MKFSKTIIVGIFFILNAFNLSAQINNKPLKDVTKPKIETPNFPKMDATIKEIIDGADGDTFKISMAALTLTKYKDRNSSYVGSTSFSAVSALRKMAPLRKTDTFTAEGSFFLNSSTAAANVKIFTTSLGGQKITIRYTEGINAGLSQIRNLKITKKGATRYIITGDSEKDGNITNYIFNIYKNEFQ